MGFNVQTYGTGQIDSGAIPVVGSGWILIGKIILGGVRGGAILQIDVAVAPITNLKLTRAATSGGTHLDWIVDTDFNSGTYETIDVIASPAANPPNIHQLAAGSSGQIKLDRLQGVPEIGLYVKGNGATVRLTGSAI